MRQLDVAPVTHFADTDYAGSELLVYRWDPSVARLLVCCLDLSEKIPHWAHGTGGPDYAARYRAFVFDGVADYRRAEVQGRWETAPDEFLEPRDGGRVPIEDVRVTPEGGGYGVLLLFERGFGEVALTCRDVRVYETTTAADDEAAGEEELLGRVYRDGPGGARTTARGDGTGGIRNDDETMHQ